MEQNCLFKIEFSRVHNQYVGSFDVQECESVCHFYTDAEIGRLLEIQDHKLRVLDKKVRVSIAIAQDLIARAARKEEYHEMPTP